MQLWEEYGTKLLASPDSDSQPDSSLVTNLTYTQALILLGINGKLLQSMMATPTSLKMCQAIDQLQDIGCRGILVSGGANSQGEVPLLPFMDSLAYACQKGLKVLVHSGIINRETAMALKAAHVDQVLIDVIGDRETIHQVYHLDRRSEDYLRAILFCREANLKIAPHVVIGLHYSTLRSSGASLDDG